MFPRRLQDLVPAVDADHQHGGERDHLDGDSHQADASGPRFVANIWIR